MAAVLTSLLIVAWQGRGNAAITADDFLPPVRAESAEEREALLQVKDPASVTEEVDPATKETVVNAPSLQDAINKIVQKPSRGCRAVQGGTVFVATGVGIYNAEYSNVIASRIAQRNACVAAFMDAKTEMARYLNGADIKSLTDLRNREELVDTSDRSLSNISSSVEESHSETVRKILKGYVTYAVQDDGKGRVFVSIVSTPKTRRDYRRNGSDGVSAASLRDGLNDLIAELKTGLVPPVGGRIIDVPGTNEVAFVGFGSSVVRKDAETDVQARLNLQAEQIAGLRASDALVGIIFGDYTRMEAHVDETTIQQKKDFETLAQSDPTAQDSEPEIKEYGDRVREFRNIAVTDTSMQSMKNGVLPPGVQRITEIDDDEYFAYGIAVYVPSLSAAVQDASREMDETAIVRPAGEQGKTAPQSASQSAADRTNERNKNLEIKKVPSGVVEQNL